MKQNNELGAGLHGRFTSVGKVILIGILLLFGLSSRAAQPLSCNDPVEGHWSYGTGYTVDRWTGTGETLLLVGNGGMLTIFDGSNSSALIRLGEVSVSDGVRSIAVSDDGNLAAVSDWRSMIHLVDISNRSAPALRGSRQIASNRQPYGLDIVGNRLYVAIRDAGLGIYDITNPDTIVSLGTLVTPGTGFVFDLKVRGNYAYLADDAEGVTVVDISNAASPVIVGGFAGSTLASRLHIEGDRAYVARRGEGFDILDLSVPTAPTRIVNVIPPAVTYGVLPLSATRVVVGGGYGGSLVYDISNPGSPALLGGEPEPVYGLTAIGSTAFVLPDTTRSSHLRAIEFSNPLAPAVLDSVDFFNASAEVRVVGSRVLVANGDSGLTILDASNPQSPMRVGGYLPGSVSVTDVEWVNGHAVVGGYGQLDVVDISNPANAQLVSTILVSDLMLDLDRNGNRLFASWGFSGMKIYDLSNPVLPSLLGTFVPSGDGAIRVATLGNLAFVSDQANRMRVVDVSNPASPQQLSQVQFASFIQDIDVEGSFVYVATALQGVRILNVSNPATPVEVSNIPFAPAIASSVAARGDRLYAAALEYGGLRMFDIGLPGSPMFLEERQTPGEALWLDMADDTIAISDGDLGVRIVSCADDILFANGFE